MTRTAKKTFSIIIIINVKPITISFYYIYNFFESVKFFIICEINYFKFSIWKFFVSTNNYFIVIYYLLLPSIVIKNNSINSNFLWRWCIKSNFLNWRIMGWICRIKRILRINFYNIIAATILIYIDVICLWSLTQLLH